MKNVITKPKNKNFKNIIFSITILLSYNLIFFSCKSPSKETELPLSKNATITSFPLANDVKSEQFIAILHYQHQLKPIKTNEKGITIKSMPNNSYCYVPFDELSDKNAAQIQEIPIHTKKEKLYYELQRYQKDKLYLLAFVTYETATNISNLDGETIKEFTFFPEKNPEYNHLAFIPLNRILQIKVRNILLDNKDSLKVHDLRIK